MAEHLNQPKQDFSDDPMNYMGKPIPFEARMVALDHAKEMGLGTVEGHALVEQMSNALERDNPYEAQKISMQFLDLTGYYRMMAVILSETMKTSHVAKLSEESERRALQEIIQ